MVSCFFFYPSRLVLVVSIGAKICMFCLSYRPLVESGKNPQKYIRYTAEDLERMLSEFFEGKNVNEPRR